MDRIRVDKVSNNVILDKLMTQGSQGKLYIGHDLNNQPVSIKIVEMNKYQNDDILDEELNILMKISIEDCNPNIICYKDMFIDEDDTDKLYMITEFIPNKNLSEVFNELAIKFDKKTELYYKIVLQFIKCLLNALVYLHDKGIIHGDIKPENIQVCTQFESIFSDGNVNLLEQYCPVLIDFSSSCWNSKCIDNPNKNVYYLAPEVITQKKTFKESDLWSLGLSLYHILIQDPWSQSKNVASLITSEKSTFNINTPNTVINYLLSTMLQYDHKKRGSAKQLYNFLSHSPSINTISN